MENTLTGLCHYASNCFICFHKGRIYSTGCKQLQVKGQCIYYPTRKGNAYFIQSASASHLGWTHSAMVTLYTGWFHFKLRHNLLWTQFSKCTVSGAVSSPPVQYGLHFKCSRHTNWLIVLWPKLNDIYSRIVWYSMKLKSEYIDRIKNRSIEENLGVKLGLTAE